jgi:hypothetical protein
MTDLTGPATIKSALFVDFDNVYLGLRKIDPLAAERFATDPGRWLGWLQAGLAGPDEDHAARTPRRFVLVRKCYLNPRSFQRYRPYFTRAAFSVIDCPPLTHQGKTGTDIHMVMDVLDALEHPTRFDEFIILSGDADFTPVLLRLRSHDRRTMILTAGPSSQVYLAACDHVITEDLFIEAGLGMSGEDAGGTEMMYGSQVRPPSADTPPDDILDEMARAVAEEAQVTGSIEAMQLPAIYKRFPAFTPQSNWLGFFGLRRLTQGLVARRPDLRLAERGETWAVTWSDVPVAVAAGTTSRAAAPVLTPQARAELRADVIAQVWAVVQASDVPVTMAAAAQAVIHSVGPLAKDTDWVGYGSFKDLLLSEPDPGFEVASSPKPGYLFDPERHELPAPEAPGGALGDRWPELADLADRVCRLTGTPLVTPPEHATVFQAISDAVGAAPFHLTTTSKTVRDLCIERGTPIARGHVSFIIKGLTYAGHRLGDDPGLDTPRVLSDVYLENVIRRCEDAGLTLSTPDITLLEAWIQGEVPRD